MAVKQDESAQLSSTPTSMAAVPPSRMRKVSADPLHPTLDATNAAANQSPTRETIKTFASSSRGATPSLQLQKNQQAYVIGSSPSSSSYSTQADSVGNNNGWQSSGGHKHQQTSDLERRSSRASESSTSSSVNSRLQGPSRSAGNSFASSSSASSSLSYLNNATATRPRQSLPPPPPVPVRSPDRPISRAMPLSPSDASLLSAAGRVRVSNGSASSLLSVPPRKQQQQ